MARWSAGRSSGCRKAEVPNLRLHDLRHTFASYLAMGSFNLRAIQQLLGHKDLRMTARYAHLSADHLQQAVKSLDAVLGSNKPIDTLWTPEEETGVRKSAWKFLIFQVAPPRFELGFLP